MPKSARRSTLETHRLQIQTTLQSLRDEKIAIIASVNNLVSKAEATAVSILKENDKTAFLNKFVSANLDLVSCLEVLFKVRDLLQDGSGSSSEQSDSDTDSPRLTAEHSPKARAAKFQLDTSTQSVESAPGRLRSQDSDSSSYSLRRWSLENQEEELFPPLHFMGKQQGAEKLVASAPKGKGYVDNLLRHDLPGSSQELEVKMDSHQACAMTSEAVKLHQRPVPVDMPRDITLLQPLRENFLERDSGKDVKMDMNDQSTALQLCESKLPLDLSFRGAGDGTEVSLSVRNSAVQADPFPISLSAIPEEGHCRFPSRLSKTLPPFHFLKNKSTSGSSESSYHSGMEDSSDTDQFQAAKEPPAVAVSMFKPVASHIPGSSSLLDHETVPKQIVPESDPHPCSSDEGVLSNRVAVKSKSQNLSSAFVEKVPGELLPNQADSFYKSGDLPSKKVQKISPVDPIDFYRLAERFESCCRTKECEVDNDDNICRPEECEVDNDDDICRPEECEVDNHDDICRPKECEVDNDVLNASMASPEKAEEKPPKLVIPPPNITPDKMVPVNVSISSDSREVNPSDFWLQLSEVGSVNDMVHMSLEGSSLVLEEKEVEVGMFCCIRYDDGMWYRIQVRHISLQDKMAEVLFVDGGKVKKVPFRMLHSLPTHLTAIPQQAVNSFLKGVQPKADNWTQEARHNFYELVTAIEANLHAKFFSPVGGMVPVDLSFDVPLGQNSTIQVHADQYLRTAGFAAALETVDKCVTAAVQLPNTLSSTPSKIELPTKSVQEIDTGIQMDTSIQMDAAVSSGGNVVSCSIDSGLGDSAKESAQCKDLPKLEHETLQACGTISKSSDDLPASSNSNSAQDCFQSSSSASFEMSDGETTTMHDFRREIPLGSRDPAIPYNESDASEEDILSCFRISPAKFDFPDEKLVSVAMAHVVSPGEFYVHIVDENTNQIDDLREQMDTYYHTVKYTKLKPSIIKRGAFCSCLYKDTSWYRAQVLEMVKLPPEVTSKSRKKSMKHRQMEARFRVRYVDYGNEEEVCFKDIMPLTPEFTRLPAFAIGCRLANIRPKCVPTMNLDLSRQPQPSAVCTWSLEATKWFNDLTYGEKCLTLQVVSSECKRDKFLPVLLWDTFDQEDLLINAMLIKKGWAEADSVEQADRRSTDTLESTDNGNSSQGAQNPNSDSTQYHHQSGQPPPVDPRVFQGFDPMTKDYLSELNTYQVNTDDISIATVGYKAKDESYICKLYQTGVCPRGERCKLQHVRTGHDPATRDIQHVVSCDIKMPLPEAGSHIFVQVSAVFNPGHFYVIMPYGSTPLHVIDEHDEISLHNGENLDILVQEMTKRYSKRVFLGDRTVIPSLGMIMAAQSRDGRWYRARVIGTSDDADNIEVFYVDFGDAEWIKRLNLQEMLPEYLHLPFQAVECFLANVEPKGAREGLPWSPESRHAFREFAETKILVAEILTKGYDNILKINLRLQSEEGGTLINDLLVVQGFAQHVPAKDMIVAPPRPPPSSLQNGGPGTRYAPG